MVPAAEGTAGRMSLIAHWIQRDGTGGASAHVHRLPAGGKRMTPLAATQLRLLESFMADAPSQPATNFWRCVELPVLAAALPAEGRGLDVGCGDGVLTKILRDLRGARWTLVGLDPVAAETALAERSGLYERVHTSGADNIPEPDASCDFVFANSVLEHIPGLSTCLGEMARCLKPGGLFAATVPSAHFHN